MDPLHCAVIVPAFNAEAFIGDTLASIRAQSLPPAEIIVVDDGSSDRSAEIAREFGPDIKLISQENRGLGMARRAGIAEARADWIALCDSDDVWRPDHLERRARLLARCPQAVFSFSDCYSFGPSADYDGGLIDAAPSDWFSNWCEEVGEDFFLLRDPLRATLDFNPIYACGLVFRRDAYHAMGGFLERYSRWRSEDLEFTRRFYAHFPTPIAGDRQQTWGYRRHGDNYSTDQWRNLLARAQILEAHVSEAVEPLDVHALAMSEASRSRGSAFDIACWDGDFAAARGLFRDELPIDLRTLRRRLRYLRAVLHK